MADIEINVSHEAEDYQRFYVAKADPDFSERKNKYTIDKTIADYEQARKNKIKAYHTQIEERVDAAMAYVKHLEKGGSSPAEKFFGKRELARLRGQKIIQEVRNGMTILSSVD